MIAQVYESSERSNKIIQRMERSTQKETSTITLNDALYGPDYKQSTYVALMVILFHELVGDSAILLYSTEIFKRMESYNTDGSSNMISPRTGTIIIGVFNLLAHIPAVYLINRLPRRTLIIGGHIMIAVCHLMIGLFALGDNDWGVILFMVLFIVTTVITNGPIIWLYVSEIVCDAALGLCLSLLWGVILLLSIMTYPLMAILTPQGVFWLFGLASLGGAWFAKANIRETMHLNDKEKKMLYQPDLPIF